MLNHRVVLHAIDATPVRWRGSSPLGHPIQWLISTQAGTRCTAAKVAEVEAALAERSTTVEIALRDSVVADDAPN